MSPMLNEMLAGKLSMAFPNVTLTQLEQRKGQPLEVYTGTGHVSLDERGRLRLQFLTQTNLSIHQTFPILEVEPGELIPKSMMFRFEGVETDGRRWVCEEFIPHFSSGPGGSIATATFGSLSTIRQVAPEHVRQSSTVTSFFKVKPSFWAVPWSSFAAETLKHPHEQAAKRGLKINGNGWKLVLAADEAWFSSHTECTPSDIANGFADKVVRALELWLGQHLEPVYEVLADGDKRTITLHSSYIRAFQNSYPPVNERAPGTVGDSLQLFRLFLDRLAADPKPDWSPLVIHTRTATASMEGPLDLMALVLSVSVEGLVRSELPTIKRAVAADMNNDIDAVTKLIQDGNYCADFKKRAPGIIGNLRGTSPRDVLLVLEGANSLPAGSEKVWSSLRNRAAHATTGGSVSQAQIEQLYQDCRAVLVLLYRLVFLALGYQGLHSDYSAKGWRDEPWTRSKP